MAEGNLTNLTPSQLEALQLQALKARHIQQAKQWGYTDKQAEEYASSLIEMAEDNSFLRNITSKYKNIPSMIKNIEGRSNLNNTRKKHLIKKLPSYYFGQRRLTENDRAALLASTAKGGKRVKKSKQTKKHKRRNA